MGRALPGVSRSRIPQVKPKLIHRQEHGLELNAFFEPHVAAWLKDTESNTTQDWVSRAVGMDSVSF
jgi:hypothetical protein